MPLQAGDIVTARVRSGPWVCMDLVPDPHGHRRWSLLQERRPRFPTSWDQGEAALTLILRPVLAAGMRLRHFGEELEVIEDRGDLVRCRTPARRRLVDHRTRAHLAIPAGESDLHRGALVAENLQRLIEEQQT